jgi:hypothetical protein
MKTYEQFKEYMADDHENESDQEQEIFLLNLKADLLQIESDLEIELDLYNQSAENKFNYNELQHRYPLYQLRNEIGEISYRAGKIANFLYFINSK